MFDPRDFTSDPRTRPEARPRRDHAKDRENRERNGHRREYDPRGTKRQTFQDRTDRAIADVGMYRNVAYRDVVDAHFDTPTRRGGPWIRWCLRAREHTAEGPQGGSYKVLTLTERGVERAERVARDQGLDSQQKAWSGLVKPASFNMTWQDRADEATRTRSVRVRIDAELPGRAA